MSGNQPQPSSPMNAAAPAPSEGHELTFGQVLALLWRGRWTILITAVLVTIASWFYSQSQGTIWRAWSRVYVDRGGNSQLGPEVLALGFSGRNYAETQAQVMVSSEVLRGAIELFLIEFPDPQIAGGGRVTVPWLKYRLRSRVGSDNDIITVSLDSPHREEACALVNQVVDGYQQFQRKMQKNSATELYGLIDKDRRRYESEYEQALKEQDEYRKANQGIGPEVTNLDGAQAGLEQVQESLKEAERNLAIALSDVETATRLADQPEVLAQMSLGMAGGGAPLLTPPAPVATPQAAAGIMSQMEALELQRAELLTELQPSHWRIESIDRNITAIRARLEELQRIDRAELQSYGKALLGMLNQQAEVAKIQRDQLRQEAAEAQSALYAVDGHAVEFGKLLARADRAKRALDTAYNELQRINIDEDASKTLAHILDYALPDQAEVAAGRPIRLLTGLLFGLLLGIGLAWFQDLIDPRMRSPDEVRRRTGLPILATLPHTTARPEDGVTMLDVWDSERQFAEAARSLRTAVYFGLAQTDGNIVQVTSAAPQDGKSTISSSLAIAMAKAGQRTLLIDADLRKPTQAKRFGYDNQRGVSTAVADDAPLSDAVQMTDLEDLHLLQSGPIPPNPTEILNSDRFARLLQEASEEYDRVIVDSPPLLPVADSRILASKCSGTVLVISTGKTTRKNATGAANALAQASARVLGIALNYAERGRGYGYGYGYGYGGYGYGGYGYGGYGYGGYGAEASSTPEVKVTSGRVAAQAASGQAPPARRRPESSPALPAGDAPAEDGA